MPAPALPLRLPMSLRRRPEPAPSEAFLLPRGDGEAALAMVSGLGEQSRVFEVAGGLLVVAGGEAIAPGPIGAGMIRLRRVARRLFVPVDADLKPALLDDEAEGLTRDRGLVFLPGGTVLQFNPGRPLPLSRLLAVDRAGVGLELEPDRPSWEAPPSRPGRADRIVEITLDLPEDDAETLIEAGGDDIGTEDPRAEDTGPSRRLLGGAAMGAGRGMMWLGQAMGLKGLSGLGAGWVSSAMAMAPRLGEALLGKQEGALRDLLREFREGDVDQALRRALPIGKGNERGASASGSAELPDRDPSYSLADILGRSRGGRTGTGSSAGAGAFGGRASYWFGGFDVQQELIREYHKAAQAAARVGDYRRAAYIYARLLDDHRLAANVLLQGGLARDAALIYLETLDDRSSAARAFEAAGEFDRALALYRELDDFERAGDLLARLGELDEALASYLLAADRIVATEFDHLKAGEMLRSRAGRPDLAFRYFVEGWKARPGPNAVACAVELARILAESGEIGPLRTLIAEADALLEPPGNEADASRFYNELALLADRPALLSFGDELRDRARVGLAGKLRQRAGPGVPPGLVSTLFGPARGWSAELIRDAEYAFRAASRPRVEERAGPSPSTPKLTPFRVAREPVTAVAFARGAGMAFLGTRSGEVVRLDLARGEQQRLGRYAMPVSSLAADFAGESVAVLWHDPDTARAVLASYSRRPDGSYRMTEGRAVTSRSAEHRPFLAPSVPDAVGLIGLWDGRGYVLLRGPSLTPWAEIPRVVEEPGQAPTSAMLLRPAGPDAPTMLLELGPSGSWACLAPGIGAVDRLSIPWEPRPPSTATGGPPVVSWLRENPWRLALSGVGDGGLMVCRSTLSLRGDSIEPEETDGQIGGSGTFLASCLVRPGLMAGIKADAVEWIRTGERHLSPVSTTGIGLDCTLAALPCSKTGELVLIGADGRAGRLPMPNR